MPLDTNAQEHVLIVEDDERLATLTREYLEANNFRVSVENDGARAVDLIISLRPDIVILDLMLPGEDGLSICRRVRPQFAGPILMLTARTDDMDQVLGLEMGADDYVPKPVQPRVLLARMRALLRRADGPEVAAGETRLGTRPAAGGTQTAGRTTWPKRQGGRRCRRWAWISTRTASCRRSSTTSTACRRRLRHTPLPPRRRPPPRSRRRRHCRRRRRQRR